MKFIYLVVLMFVISCGKSNKKTRSLKELMVLPKDNTMIIEDTISNIYSQKFNIQITDTVSMYYFKGILKQLFQLRNGVPNGIVLEFDEYGNCLSIGNMKKSKSHGYFYSFNHDEAITKLSILMFGEKIVSYEGQKLDSLINKNSYLANIAGITSIKKEGSN